VIRDKRITVEDGHHGKPDLHVEADTETWLGFLAKEKSIVWALIRRKIRFKGLPGLLLAFGRCFPH
jgi:putative sterol carrier protein